MTDSQDSTTPTASGNHVATPLTLSDFSELSDRLTRATDGKLKAMIGYEEIQLVANDGQYEIFRNLSSVKDLQALVSVLEFTTGKWED